MLYSFSDRGLIIFLCNVIQILTTLIGCGCVKDDDGKRKVHKEKKATSLEWERGDNVKFSNHGLTNQMFDIGNCSNAFAMAMIESFFGKF